MYSEDLYEFLLSVRYESLEKNVVEKAKMCIQDIIGVSIAGSGHTDAKAWRDYFMCGNLPGNATVWHAGFDRLEYCRAAALNAVYGHILDFDDLHNSSIVHLGVITIPAGLAISQQQNLSGRELIASVVCGYELGARVGEAINPSSYKYWHTTAVVGALASACTCAKLLQLPPSSFADALGSAGTQASGLWAFLEDGAMSKVLHVANAALCGIRSAKLAQIGVTGAKHILTGKYGLINALAPNPHPESLSRDLGVHYKIESNSFKAYACCRHTHSAISCCEMLMDKHHLDFRHIASVADYTYKTAAELTDQAHPATLYAHKFSLQYCIAAAFVYHGRFNEAFTEQHAAAREVSHLMSKINVIADANLTNINNNDRNIWPHRLVVTMADGTVYSALVNYPFGDYNNPFRWEDADQKFRAITGHILSPAQQAYILNNIKNLEQLSQCDKLFP